MANSIDAYESTVGSGQLDQLRELARDLGGVKVVHVNSTSRGGGVAEILEWMIPLMRELGLDASWEVLEGDDDFYRCTKTLHNGLQGHPVTLTQSMMDAYESTIAENAERLRAKLEDADYVIIHDPQPAALLAHCPKRKGKWIWRCHIDASRPVRRVWGFVRSKVSAYDSSIFSMPQFAHELPHPQFIIAPSIDPLSAKNEELTPEEVRSELESISIPEGKPLLTQVSRFDRFKDPVGVIQAFRILRETIDAALVLVGGGASDDPEGQQVFEQTMEAANGDPDIHILMLPSDSHRTINAIQRASTVVIQKSIQEGFGLTVTEGLWKGRPVIGGNVGGIRAQVHNYYNGFLVDSPEGATLRLRYLLRRPELAEKMGQRGREFVRQYFLLTRHLREYLILLLGLKRGLENRLMA